MEPKRYAWIVPARLAVAERPGRGGRSHRRELRPLEIEWWCGQGVTAVVSSHQLDLADRATRCIGLRDGEVVHDGDAGRAVVHQLTGG